MVFPVRTIGKLKINQPVLWCSCTSQIRYSHSYKNSSPCGQTAGGDRAPRIMMMIAFIGWNSNLKPLLEGLCRDLTCKRGWVGRSEGLLISMYGHQFDSVSNPRTQIQMNLSYIDPRLGVLNRGWLVCDLFVMCVQAVSDRALGNLCVCVRCRSVKSQKV